MEKLRKLEWCTISTYHSGTILQNFLISFALFGGHALHIAYICIKGFWRSSLFKIYIYNFEGVKNYFTYWNYNQRNVDISRVFFQNILYVQFFFEILILLVTGKVLQNTRWWIQFVFQGLLRQTLVLICFARENWDCELFRHY